MTNMNLPVLDQQDLRNRLLNDDELVRTICQAFLGDIPQQLQSLGQAITNGDTAKAGMQAHTIKGATSNIGAKAMSAVALEAETAGKAGNLNELNIKYIELQKQFVALKEEIDKMLAAQK